MNAQKWKEELSVAEIEQINPILLDKLVQLGYVGAADKTALGNDLHA